MPKEKESYSEEIRGHSIQKFKQERLRDMKELICDEVPKRVANNLRVRR